MTTITIDPASAELPDFALDLLVQTLEDGKREAAPVLDDVARYGAEWDAYAPELEAQRCSA
jgi:hypothetical protein